MRHTSTNSTVFHDGWKAYNSIDYARHSLTHRENIDEQGDRHWKDQAHIESIWS